VDLTEAAASNANQDGTKRKPKASRRSEMAELEVFSGEALEAMNLNEIKGDVATLEG
jgi:hypothetical protein